MRRPRAFLEFLYELNRLGSHDRTMSRLKHCLLEIRQGTSVVAMHEMSRRTMRSPSWLLFGGGVFEQFCLVVAISESLGGSLISSRLAAIGLFFQCHSLNRGRTP